MRASLPGPPSTPPEPAAIEAVAAGGLIVADHGHLDEDGEADVADLVKGVRSFLAEYLCAADGSAAQNNWGVAQFADGSQPAPVSLLPEAGLGPS